MDQPLGEKILDDFTLSDLLMGKDRFDPHFESKETAATYILIAHLKGCYRESIKVEISDDGTQIAIGGSKPVQETVMVVGWKVPKRDVTMRRYRKVFRIPNGVVLDKIYAWYNKSESTSTILMTKAVEGIIGVEIEEVKEGEITAERFRALEITDVDVIAERATSPKIGTREDDTGLLESEGGNGDEGEHQTVEKKESDDDDQLGEAKPAVPGKRSEMCVPIIAGSALLLYAIVFVIHLVRKPRKEKH